LERIDCVDAKLLEPATAPICQAGETFPQGIEVKPKKTLRLYAFVFNVLSPKYDDEAIKMKRIDKKCF